MRARALLLLVLCSAALQGCSSAALCSVTASGSRLRLAGSDDLVRVAQLQLDTFDPELDTPASIVNLSAPDSGRS